MNVNLLGEVYSEGEDNSKRLLRDKTKNKELYYRLKSKTSILIYPVFVNSQEFQIVYETSNAKSYNSLASAYRNLMYDFQELDVIEYTKMFKRRLEEVHNSSLSSSYLLDFRYASELNLIDRFPYLNMNTEFNRIFSGRVLGKDLFITDNYVKVITDNAYTTQSSSAIHIKRTPEKSIHNHDSLGMGEHYCKTEIKFKTTDIVKILELCKEINPVYNYYSTDLFREDLEIKMKSALTFIRNKNYDEALCHRLINVLSLVMYRPDLANKSVFGKDLVVNIILENEKYFDTFISDTNRYLNIDALKYLKGIYFKSDYRYIC